MQVLVALLAATAMFSTSCAFAEDTSVFVEDVQCVGGRFGLSMPTDIRALKRMSKVVREEIEEVEHWEGYTATRKTLYFDGLTLGVIEFSNDPAHFMVTFAVLTGPKWNRISPFKLRRPVAEAASLLGAPAKTDPRLLRTYASEGDSVNFQSSGSIVTRVSYECYSG